MSWIWFVGKWQWVDMIHWHSCSELVSCVGNMTNLHFTELTSSRSRIAIRTCFTLRTIAIESSPRSSVILHIKICSHHLKVGIWSCGDGEVLQTQHVRWNAELAHWKCSGLWIVTCPKCRKKKAHAVRKQKLKHWNFLIKPWTTPISGVIWFFGGPKSVAILGSLCLLGRRAVEPSMCGNDCWFIYFIWLLIGIGLSLGLG